MVVNSFISGIRGSSSGIPSIKEFIPVKVFQREDFEDMRLDEFPENFDYSIETQGFNKGPVKRKHLKRVLEIRDSFKRPFHLQRNLVFNDTSLDRMLFIEVKKYLTSVEAYLQTIEQRLDEKNEVRAYFSQSYFMRQLSNFDFSSEIKRIRLKSFLKTHDMTLEEQNEDLIDIPDFFIGQIDEIFNYRYCFFWEEETDSIDDYKYGLIPIDISEKDLKKREKEFKTKLEELISLKKDPQRISPEDIFCRSSTSASLTKNGSRPQWINKCLEAPELAENPEIGKRAIIPVYPQGYRDSVVYSTRMIHSIQLIEEFCAQICEKLPNSAYFRSELKILRRISKFENNSSYFYNRDLKKEGITKPRFLISWVLDVLAKAYNHIQPELDYIKDIYSSYSLRLEDGSVISMNRGHGLGMANALTTIIQQVIFSITLDRLGISRESDQEIDAIFYNDDCSIGFSELDELLDYIEVEDKTLLDFGIIKNYKKSHFGRCWVFCEKYPDSFNRKSSYYQREIMIPFCAINIVHAKELFCSVVNAFKKEDSAETLKELIRFWGIEFNQQEIGASSLFGGWYSSECLGVLVDFIDDRGIDPMMIRMYESCEGFVTPLAKSRLKEKEKSLEYTHTMTYLYGDLNLPKDIDLGFFSGTMRQYEKKIHKFNTNSEFENYYVRLKRERAKIFQNWKFKLSEYKNLDLLYLRMTERFPEKDIIPPKGSRNIILNTVDLSEEATFERNNLKNGLTSAIAVYNHNNKKLRRFSPIIDLRSKISRKLSQWENMGKFSYIKPPFISQFVEEPYDGKITSIDLEFLPTIDTYRYYINPGRVCQILYYKQGHCNELPIGSPRKILLESRRQLGNLYDFNSYLFYFLSKDDYDDIINKIRFLIDSDFKFFLKLEQCIKDNSFSEFLEELTILEASIEIDKKLLGINTEKDKALDEDLGEGLTPEAKELIDRLIGIPDVDPDNTFRAEDPIESFVGENQMITSEFVSNIESKMSHDPRDLPEEQLFGIESSESDGDIESVSLSDEYDDEISMNESIHDRSSENSDEIDPG